MFFQNSFLGPFLEGPSAELFEKVGFGCHFRFLGFSERHLLETIFGDDGTKSGLHPTGVVIFFATLLFTKPQ
jgi:hypothetical protein